MAVSSSTFQAEVAGVLVAVFLTVVAIYALFRYLRRRGPELAAREGRGVLEDRSYNRIRIGHAAADHLAKTGVDVSHARALLDRADTARKGGDHETSMELSKKAQDLLAATRTAGAVLPSDRTPSNQSQFPVSRPVATVSSDPPATPTSPAPAPRPRGIPNGLPDGSDGEPNPAQSSNRPPKNKMEAHFQLSVARDEVGEARASKSDSPSFREAEALLTQGQQAYDRSDFTEALRLALRSRRTLGARVEALPVTVPSASNPPPAGAAFPPRPMGGPTEEITDGPRCANCGRPASVADQFCRGCGARIGTSRCAQCGAPLVAGDRFCGKCGATQPSTVPF